MLKLQFSQYSLINKYLNLNLLKAIVKPQRLICLAITQQVIVSVMELLNDIGLLEADTRISINSIGIFP
jgi:hypothetical protein